MSLHEVAFAGVLVPGADEAQVKANLAKLFQADAQRIALLFSGRRTVIKNGLDEETAKRYQQTLARAGAQVEVSLMGAEPAPAAPPATPAAAATQAAQAVSPAPAAAQPSGDKPSGGRLNVAARDEYMAVFSEVDAPDLPLAPLGADIGDAKPEVAPPPLDLSGMQLAPVGSDMGQAKAPPAPPAPDTSHLKLEE